MIMCPVNDAVLNRFLNVLKVYLSVNSIQLLYRFAGRSFSTTISILTTLQRYGDSYNDIL